MAFLHSYIVFIININDEYQTGLTKDIDQALDEYQQANLDSSLVFQRHFDRLEEAQEFRSRLEKMDSNKKKALINGDLDFS